MLDFDPEHLWDALDHQVSYKWPVGNKAAERLHQLLPASTPKASRDILVRQVGPELLGERGSSVATWIVKDWGGIRATSDEWSCKVLGRLGTFQNEHVDAFILSEGMKRISSWSKLLTFYDDTRWAIYDSRTAVALNAAFLKLGKLPRFPMPASRNTKIVPCREYIRKEHRATLTGGYRDYVSLLGSLRERRGLPSISDVEMVLFANAEAIIVDFMSWLRA